MSRIYVIHENNEWVEPLRDKLSVRGLPFEEWFLNTGAVDLGKTPPEGVFYNRMSASSHSRDHRYAPEYTAAVIAWLENHGRRVLNGGRALQLEISKVAQYTALEAEGVRVPRTVAAVGSAELIAAAEDFQRPFITKHNRAGKGLGVRLFQDVTALTGYVNGPEFVPSVDGITLLQEYIASPKRVITRVEFVGCRLLYALEVDTSQGFELCPADACRVDDAFCPVGEEPGLLFRIQDRFEHPLVAAYQRVMAANDIHIAGIEFVVDSEGVPYTYDINTNTNYNTEAEEKAGRSGMDVIAEYLGRELVRVERAAS
ncbi:MAG: alpha-L-glutamate ligase [Acidobacteria bacterium]|nr:alpha-L-glutamate ligase [Acidobacteriota bacterium]